MDSLTGLSWQGWLTSLLSICGLILLIYNTFFIVAQQTNIIIERFGKFVRIAKPGLNLKIPLVERIATRMILRVMQLEVPIETKTEDNVFVKVVVAVQYFVLPDKVYEAYYKLLYPDQQITSYVFDVVRAKVPKMKLDDVFDKKDEIADAVKGELSHTMNEFGYGIVKALVTDIEPDPHVKAAMNEINAATRLRIAASEKGEADRILRVKTAEAEAQSKKLQGEGIANQRKAIIEGLQTSVEQFKSAVGGTTAADVMHLVLLTQYFDTLKEVGSNSKATILMLPSNPNGMKDFADQIRQAIITGEAINKVT